MKKKKLGEVLRERGQISAADLASAIAEQQGKVIRLGELLMARGVVVKDDLASALEQVTRIPYVNCALLPPAQAALALLPRQVADRCLGIPIAVQDRKLVVVMAEPQNLALINELKFRAGMDIDPRFGFRAEILAAIEQHYDETPLDEPVEALSASASEDEANEAVREMEFVSTSSKQANREALQEVQAELLHQRTPAVRIASEVILAAQQKQASDIHIEPQANGVIVRIRVDGVLRELRRVPRTHQYALISRIKIISDMDIAERRAPQDGRFLVRMGSKQLDMRVSSLPTQYGEKIVMRLLDPDAALRSFPELGFSEEADASLREILALPQGMLLVTGPTGSGKSSTLYAALNILRQPAVNIVTLEDPVEYVMAGINQVHVNNKAGLNFASCLRSVLRQDPNVIMVGEIRDKETAETAMKAAQTGHLVLSTLHTNDSVSAVTRLLDLHVPGFLVASSVTAIVAQRLLRCLCDCRDWIRVTMENAERLAALGLLDPVDSVCVPVGCEACDQTGYRGRVGVYEILRFDDSIREAVRAGTTHDDIRKLVRTLGMKLMQQDALEKILLGRTSVEEVARVVPVQASSSGDCTGCGRKLVQAFSFCPHCGTQQAEPASHKPQHSSTPTLRRDDG
ncbi:MAG: ATPase, T2SS/T4P/T4SS family [Candidatus Acidiferrales bacterium]